MPGDVSLALEFLLLALTMLLLGARGSVI